MSRNIGFTRREAINWTQDTLKTTRPIAEAVFAHLVDTKGAVLNESGYVLFEDEEEMQKQKIAIGLKMSNQSMINVAAMRQNRHRRTKERRVPLDWSALHETHDKAKAALAVVTAAMVEELKDKE